MIRRLSIAALVGGSLLAAAPSFAAQLVLVNTDVANIGFNDPTPAAPVGGNAGTTLGEQRLIAYRRALDLWGSVLRSNVPVRVRGSFARLNCTAGGGVLASAGALAVFADFPSAPVPGVWYGAALANSIAGVDLDPTGDDIQANFNGAVGQPDCIAGPGFYYGLDNNPPAGAIDFLNTFMHEVAHGLGFQNFVNEATGLRLAGRDDIYMVNTRDLTLDQQWTALTAAQIVQSSIRNGQVVWTGTEVNANQSLVLGAFEGVRVTGNVSAELNFGTASFGALLTAATLDGDIVAAVDADGTLDPSDACGPLVNPASYVGRVVLANRGTCGFAVKAANAQAAGAKAVMIANNVAGAGAIALGGVDPAVTIAAIGISREDGALIRTGLPGVAVEYFTDPTRRSGSTEGLVRLFAPTVVAVGSSISHYDTVATPNLLMEPSITPTLRASRTLDLTPALMQDIGWQLEPLTIGTCATGVANALPNGELLSVGVEACIASSKNHGQTNVCIKSLARDAEARGLLSKAQVQAVSFCGATGTK